MTLQCTGIMVGHVSPEAYCGGNIAFIQNGDIVTIDPVSKTLGVVCLSLVITMCMHSQVCMSETFCRFPHWCQLLCSFTQFFITDSLYMHSTVNVV